jgi:hypothetical protein
VLVTNGMSGLSAIGESNAVAGTVNVSRTIPH